jgi:hypothetical protein
MPKHTRVAILMAAMIIFAIAMLNLVRSKAESSGRAVRSAAVQYSTLRRIYVSRTDLVSTTVNSPTTRQDTNGH